MFAQHLPKKYNDLLRKALRTVLVLEADAIRRLRLAVAEASIEARAALLTLEDDDQVDTEAIAAIRDGAWKIYLAIVALLLLLRRGAREAASTQFEAEALLAGLDLSILFVTFQPSTEEDQARAESVARSFSAAWMLAALAARRKQRDPVGAVNNAEDYRLRRIAGTEIPHAYGRAHTERMAELADVLGDDAALWAQRWDATLDLKTCAICKRMHGEIAPLGAAFSGGLLPGDVHPFCRCVPSLIPIPAVLEKAA